MNSQKQITGEMGSNYFSRKTAAPFFLWETHKKEIEVAAKLFYCRKTKDSIRGLTKDVVVVDF